jgi:multicomponent Na+:H+ antiporter subunit C
MTRTVLFSLTAAGLFGIGFYGFMVHNQLLRKILALSLMGNAVFLLLIALARRSPVATDPIPHAMVLTGIVISVATMAFALMLGKRLYRETGSAGVEETEEDEA